MKKALINGFSVFCCGNDSVHIVLFNGPVHDKIRTIPDLIGENEYDAYAYHVLGDRAHFSVRCLRALLIWKQQRRKITHMILRLFYIIVIITGAQLFKVHGMERRIHSEGLARPHHHRIHGNAFNPQEKRKSGHWDLDRLYCRSALDGCAWTPASAGL